MCCRGGPEAAAPHPWSKAHACSYRRISRFVGVRHDRVDGVAKVTGRAAYAVEHDVPDPLHLWLVQSTVARGRVIDVDASRALAHDGVVAVLDHTSTPRLADTENAELAKRVTMARVLCRH